MGCNRSRCQQVCAQSINHHVIIPAPAPCAAPCGGLGFGGLGYDGIGLGGLGYGGAGCGLGGAGLVGAGLAGPGLAGPGCGLYWDNNVS
jgi:hypothetical protein